MRVVIDTDVWISFMLGGHMAGMQRALLSEQVEVCICDELIREIGEVAGRPKIRKHIGPKDMEQTLELMQRYCSFVACREAVAAEVRDKDDLFLLALAKAVGAEYIITGDKDLLVLGSFHNTRIITPAEAFRLLPMQ